MEQTTSTEVLSLTCPRCGYATSHRSNMKKHLERKTPCPAVLEDVSIERILSERQDLVRHPQDSSKQYHCDLCDFTFTTPQSLCRHRLHRCRNRHVRTNTTGSTADVVDAGDRVQEELNSLRQQVQELQQRLPSIPSSSSANNQNNSNSNNNTICNNNNNNTVTTTNNYVQIYAFGKQPVDHLLEDTRFMDQCLKRREKGLVEFVQRIHYDADHPENHNVKATNAKSAFVKTFDGQRWVLCDKDEVLSELLEEGCNGLDTHYEENKDALAEHLSETMRTLIDEFMEKLKDREPNVRFAKELKQRLFITLLNGTGILVQR